MESTINYEAILIEPKRIDTIRRDRNGKDEHGHPVPPLKPEWDEMFCLEYQQDNHMEIWSKLKCFNPTREQIEAVLTDHRENPPSKPVGHPIINKDLTVAQTNAYFAFMENVNSFWNKRKEEKCVLHRILSERYPNCSFRWELGQLLINNAATKITATEIESAIGVLEKTFGRINVGKVIAEVIDSKLEEIYCCNS